MTRSQTHPDEERDSRPSASGTGCDFTPRDGTGPVQNPLDSQPDFRVSASFEGPLPPPTILSGYNEVIPGLAESISANWLKESEFRRRHQTVTEVEIPKRGQTYGFVIMVLALGVCGYAVHLGHTGWGIAGMMGSLASVVAVMMWRRSDR